MKTPIYNPTKHRINTSQRTCVLLNLLKYFLGVKNKFSIVSTKRLLLFHAYKRDSFYQSEKKKNTVLSIWWQVYVIIYYYIDINVRQLIVKRDDGILSCLATLIELTNTTTLSCCTKYGGMLFVPKYSATFV